MPRKIYQVNKFSQIPNKVINALPLLDLTCYEYKVLIKLIRETYGHHRRTAEIGKGTFLLFSNVSDRRMVRRSLQSLIKIGVIDQITSPDNFTDSAKYRINDEFFDKVIHSHCQKYPKLSKYLGVPQPPPLGVPQPPPLGVPQPPFKQSIKESIKENNNGVLFDVESLNQELKKTQLTEDQAFSILCQISKTLKSPVKSQFVQVRFYELLTQPSFKKARDQHAWLLGAARNQVGPQKIGQEPVIRKFLNG